MPFLPPNQQHLSTEGKVRIKSLKKKCPALVVLVDITTEQAESLYFFCMIKEYIGAYVCSDKSFCIDVKHCNMALCTLLEICLFKTILAADVFINCGVVH